MGEPSREDWSALYEAAMTFNRAAPWRWMGNEDLFAVENPSDGEIGYCVILGSEAEEFGLAVFVGAEGFEGYRRIVTGEVEPDNIEASATLRSLSVTFVDREVLGKRDLDVIRSLGLRFRGKNAWPFFRSQLPGYLPWCLDRDEALFLTIALQQALEVATQVQREGLDLFRGADAGLILTRYPYAGRWLEEWRKPVSLKREVGAPEPPDEARLQRLKVAGKLRGSWEVDFFLLPTAVRSGLERPYHPTCILAVERQVGLIVGTELMGPCLSAAERQEAFIRVLERAKQLPIEIRVARDEVRGVIELVAQALGVSVRVARLPLLEKAKGSLFERFL